MVGNKDQIESVGPGNVFKEMIDSGEIPVTVLDECFRQEEDSTIIQNADKINANRMDLRFDDTFRFCQAADAAEASEMVQKIYKEELERRGGYPEAKNGKLCFRRMLRRNIFYTAVTRAQEKVIIVGRWRKSA